MPSIMFDGNSSSEIRYRIPIFNAKLIQIEAFAPLMPNLTTRNLQSNILHKLEIIIELNIDRVSLIAPKIFPTNVEQALSTAIIRKIGIVSYASHALLPINNGNVIWKKGSEPATPKLKKKILSGGFAIKSTICLAIFLSEQMLCFAMRI